MKHKIEIAPNNAIYIDGERTIGSKPYGLFLTTTMIVSDDDLERLADRCLAVIADRKTEPIKIVMPKAHGRKQALLMIDEIMTLADLNSSEKPNNCEDLQDWKDRMWAEAIVTEPTISKMEQVDKDINVRSKYEPKICDTCRYYNSNIPCGSTPSACKEADKFAEEFVDGLKKLKPKGEPQTERSNE